MLGWDNFLRTYIYEKRSSYSFLDFKEFSYIILIATISSEDKKISTCDLIMGFVHFREVALT
jgi:hypothetical protein